MTANLSLSKLRDELSAFRGRLKTSCKDMISDLYSLFPSDRRQKRWDDQNLDVAEMTVEYVQRSALRLIKHDLFKNAVDEREEASRRGLQLSLSLNMILEPHQQDPVQPSRDYATYFASFFREALSEGHCYKSNLYC